MASSCILSHVWYSLNIQKDKPLFNFAQFSVKNIHYVSQLFNDNDSITKWHEFKREYDLY